MDAEMVGVGPNGMLSRLARLTLVNWKGAAIYVLIARLRKLLIIGRPCLASQLHAWSQAEPSPSNSVVLRLLN